MIPQNARQRFFTKEMEGGCSQVRFCNKSDRDLTDSEIEELTKVAEKLFNNLPHYTLFGDLMYFYVHIIISNDGVMLLRNREKSYRREVPGKVFPISKFLVHEIEVILQSYSDKWKHADNVVHKNNDTGKVEIPRPTPRLRVVNAA
jgi:hypothetical protein